MDSLKFLHKIYGIISANHSCCMQYAYLIFTDSIYEKLLPNLAPVFALFMYCFLDAHQFHFYPASDIITAGDFVITVFFSFCEVFVCNLLTGLKMAETLPLMNLAVQIKFIGSGFYWVFIKYKVFLQKKADTRITIIPCSDGSCFVACLLLDLYLWKSLNKVVFFFSWGLLGKQ